MSNPSPLLFSPSPMDIGTVTTTTTGTIPTHVPAQVVRPVATSGLMLVERRVVRRYKENAAEEAVASERSIGCIQGKAIPDGEALNTSKVVTQTKQSNTRTGQDKVNIKQLPQVKHWPKSSRYKAVATSIGSSSGSLWKEHRTFTIGALREFGFGKRSQESTIKEEVEVLMRVMGEQNGTPFKIKGLLTLCVSNIMCSIIFGKRYEHTDKFFMSLLEKINENLSNGNVLFLATIFLFSDMFPVI
ncbi:CYP2K [Mytilus coruscus]|uniref:CYP2K n=1 Tax=Mytilus coruscus TaxID=42192 RepID=A0A6J8AHZ8_MYTCO|nr:CYP2K [Mytilus coruscus]